MPFRAAGVQVGWITPGHAERLRAWPRVFRHDRDGITLSDAPRDARERTQTLADVIHELAEQTVITGWRNEQYAVCSEFGAPPLFYLERAAARFFGIATYAAHLNGVVRIDSGIRMWLARRSPSKPIDPGMLDNLVGGGIAAGLSVRETLVKEAWEEAGIAPEVAGRATPGRTLEILRQVPEGVQQEKIFVFDLVLAPDFTPVNQDGEVSEHRLSDLQDVVGLLERGDEITVDASLVMLDFLFRSGTLPEPEFPEAARIIRPEFAEQEINR